MICDSSTFNIGGWSTGYGLFIIIVGYIELTTYLYTFYPYRI